ncbi:MAG: aldo/keto reductase, partial [Chloroflexota bacterium]|nr:aldo/keto reductase [Chloroflexota bacterium]
MRYRTLGRTDLRVSEVGFGGGGIGRVWGATTDEGSIRAVHRALELGVTFFDVAPGYGSGKAEELVGQGLKGHRAEVNITTKISLPPDKAGDKRGYILTSIEGSLRRLQTDHVELLLVHNPISSRRGVPYQGCITGDDALEMAEVFSELQQAGKVR